jgi:hypothetical protein
MFLFIFNALYMCRKIPCDGELKKFTNFFRTKQGLNNHQYLYNRHSAPLEYVLNYFSP